MQLDKRETTIVYCKAIFAFPSNYLYYLLRWRRVQTHSDHTDHQQRTQTKTAHFLECVVIVLFKCSN